MISFSQLNEQMYVDSILSESFLTEVKTYTRSPKEIKKLKAMEKEAKREQRAAEASLEKQRVEQERQKRLKDQFAKKIDLQMKQIDSDNKLSDREKELEIENAKLENALKLKELDGIAAARKDEIEKLKLIQQNKKDQVEEKEKLIQRKLEIQHLDAERKMQRDLRTAERSFNDVFKDAAIGTLDGVGAAIGYSTKAMFAFVRNNPLAAAGISTAIVFDQVIFNHPFFRSVTGIKGGLIPNFIGWSSSKVLDSAGISFMKSLVPYIAILAVSGIGLYAAYKLIRFMFKIGEIKANQIINRLEAASEDEKEEILRRELKVNTRKLKKQGA